MNFLDQVQKYADEAPEAGFRQLQYGKLTITPLVVTWGGKGVAPVVNEMAEGQELKDRETLRLRFSIDIQEFNPQLEFEWYREVDVRKSGKGADNKTDWGEIVEPSLRDVFGDKQALTKAQGAYVEVEDVPSTRGTYTNKQGETKQLNTVKFLRKFANKEECLVARNETYKKSEDTVSGLPANVVEQVKNLYQSVSQNDETFKSIVGGIDELKQYDAEILLAAANPL